MRPAGLLGALGNRQRMPRPALLGGAAIGAVCTLAASAPAQGAARASGGQAAALRTTLVAQQRLRRSVLLAHQGHILLSKGYN
jgi:hypothetical protein